MLVMEEVQQATIRQGVYSAERWNLRTECPEERFKVKNGDANTLCDILVCTTLNLNPTSSTHLSQYYLTLCIAL